MELNWYQQQAVTHEQRKDALRRAAQRQLMKQARSTSELPTHWFIRLMTPFSLWLRSRQPNDPRATSLNLAKE